MKAGAHAIKHLGADVLVLDDGLQYLKLKHRHDIVLIDKTAPFGSNGHMLPHGTLREPPRNLRRASYIFITKSDGDSDDLVKQIRRVKGREVFDKLVRLIAEPRRVPPGILPADFMEAT